MEKVTFVILHFLNIEDSLECIYSIKKNVRYSHFHIIVVDNGSPNGTGTELSGIFSNDKSLTVLLNEKNLGFAKGNNVGYSYARNELKSDFIIIINNDIIIEQPDFIELLIQRYNKKPYHILGPDIISLLDNGHQNPRTEILTNPNVIRGFIRRYAIMYFLSLFNLDLRFLRIKKKLFPFSKLPSSLSEKIPFQKESEGAKLHGSALVFSKEFIEKYEYCFHPQTFMYNEESILNYIAARDHLITLYYPEVKLFHKEDGATNKFLKSKKRKRSFYYKNFRQSANILLKLMSQ